MMVTVEFLDTNQPRRLAVDGRPAWALLQLHAAGVQGCTPITNPAPRWAAYVHRLRQAGLEIETVTEAHGGPFAGHHARYVLRSTINIIERSDRAESEAA